MAAIGGFFREITFSHPTLGDFVFNPVSSEEATYDPGGIRKEDNVNSVTGSGGNITNMTQNKWYWEGAVTNDMNTNKDAENALSIAEDPLDGDFTATHVNGTVLAGTGSIVGDIQPNAKTAIMTLKFSGGGKLIQQV